MIDNEEVYVVYSIPHQGFVLRKSSGTWRTQSAVNEKSALIHLCSLGMTQAQAKARLKNVETLPTVHGFDLRPGAPHLFRNPDDDNDLWLNTWVPSRVVPVAGEFPVIESVLQWMTKGDDKARSWLVNWMAYKIQNPAAVPKVAVVFATAPGAGKGFLARVMSEILGPENCAIVKQAELDNRFNSRWVTKLFVLGDEILSTDNTKDISNLLKILVDGNVLELEAKGVDQISIKSKLAWMFASNDRISPIIVDSNDRRYSVFTNHDVMPEEYKASLLGCFEVDRETMTDAFRAEVAAFAHYLLNWKFDAALLVTPLANEDRASLIDSNKPSHETFFDEIESGGLEDLLEFVEKDHRHGLPKDRKYWHFGEDGVSCQVIYQCYVEHCKRTGHRALRQNKFGGAVKARKWLRRKHHDAKHKKSLYVYQLPKGSLQTA